MYACLGSGPSPGRLNSINRGLPPLIQNTLSGQPVFPCTFSFSDGTPSVSHAHSTTAFSMSRSS